MVWLKRLAWGLGGLLTLAMIALAIMLVPAHIQIRSIEPDLPTKAELVALTEAPDQPVRISYFITSEQENGSSRMAHSTFVIEWEDGRILLIDPGMDRETAEEFSKLVEVYFGAEPAEVHGNVTDLMGAEIDRVTGIAFTHLHVDHVQGIEPFCAATTRSVAALQSSLQATETNFNTSDQLEMIGQSACLMPSVLPSGTHASPDFPGIGVYSLGGHTPGSTLFVVPVDGKLWLLTGDIANTREDLIENRPKDVFYRYIMVPEHSDRQEELRVMLTELDSDPQITAIVSHDADAIEASGMPVWPPLAKSDQVGGGFQR